MVFKVTVLNAGRIVLRSELHFPGDFFASNAGDKSEHEVSAGRDAS